MKEGGLQKKSSQDTAGAIERNSKASLLAVCRLQSANNNGFSLVEMLISLSIFSVLISVVFTSFDTQVKHTTREYKLAESDMEVGIAKSIIERDIGMAGYGLAEDYGTSIGDVTCPSGLRSSSFTGNFCIPGIAVATNANPDTLTLMGTALGMETRAAQGWTYIASVDPTFRVWGDTREDVKGDATGNDVVILMEPSTKRLLAQATEWLFKYDGSNATPANRLTSRPSGITFLNPAIGTLVYGFYSFGDTVAAQPYYAVWYGLGGASPSNCAGGTQSLLRNESRTTIPTNNGDPLLSCVLDFQVAFGLDSNEDGSIDLWDNGGVTAAGYDSQSLRRRLKQIRVYILMQSGNYDPNYSAPANIDVGETLLGTGRSVPLTAAQRKFRWRVVSLNATPRNIR